MNHYTARNAGRGNVYIAAPEGTDVSALIEDFNLGRRVQDTHIVYLGGIQIIATSTRLP